MMNKMIYLDMDNTINDFYKNDWLERIIAEDTKPYDVAPCVVKEEILLKLIKNGYKIGIISWLARDSSKNYDKAVRKAKMNWLKKYYPNVDFAEIHIVKYGTPKYSVAKIKESYLFDDELPNRQAWKGIALEPKEIFNFLR